MKFAKVESYVRSYVLWTIDKCDSCGCDSAAAKKLAESSLNRNQLKLEIQQQVTDFGLLRDIYQFYGHSARALIKVHANATQIESQMCR